MEKSSSPITKFSLWFSKRVRVTILLFLIILTVGTLAYTSFLKREQLPSINIPIGFIEVEYLAYDTNKVNEEIAQPVEEILLSVEEITQVETITYPTGTNIVMNFKTEITSQEGVEIAKNEIFRNYEFPDLANYEFNALDASKYAEEYDMFFTVTSQGKSLEEIQTLAEEIKSDLELNSDVQRVEVIKPLREATNVETGELEQNQITFTRVGREINSEIQFSDAVAVGVVKQNAEQGVIEFSELINEELEDYRQQDDVSIVMSIGDPAVGLNQQIDSLESNAFQALLVVLIVLFFLVNWRASIVSVIFIPTVFAATFLGMMLIGYSLNVMTLFALILVLGLIVDDAIVVVEAIDYEKRNGVKGLAAVKSAIDKIGVADISGTITTLIVFMPMALMTGILGDFIVFIPITVIVALVASIIIGLTVIPFLSNLIFTDKTEKKKEGVAKVLDTMLNGTNRAVTGLGEKIGHLVKVYISKPIGVILTIILGFVFIAGGLASATQVEVNNFPSPKDSDQLSITVNFSQEASLEESVEIIKRLEEGIKLYDEYVKGAEYIRFWGERSKSTTQFLELTSMTSRSKTSVELAEEMNSDFEAIENANIEVNPAGVTGGSEEYPFKLRVYSNNEQELLDRSSIIKEFLMDKQINDEVNVEDVRVNYTDILAKVDGRRYVSVEAKLNDSTTQTLELLKQEVDKEYSEERLEELGWGEESIGYSLGIEEEFAESIQSAGYAMIVAIVVMYAFLVLQFNSFIQPLLIFMAIPFSFPGLFPGLVITNNEFSFFVIIGSLGLMGIAVNNTIMLLDYANQLREEGQGISESISEAVKVRFRPLLVTSITTITGLIPLALRDPFWESIAYTIIFGLFASTLMVILVFPAYYAAVEYIRTRIIHRFLPFLK